MHAPGAIRAPLPKVLRLIPKDREYVLAMFVAVRILGDDVPTVSVAALWHDVGRRKASRLEDRVKRATGMTMQDDAARLTRTHAQRGAVIVVTRATGGPLSTIRANCGDRGEEVTHQQRRS
jgi:hypothetical protein